MKIGKKIEKYNIDKQHLKELEEIMNEKKNNISGFCEKSKRPKDKCIGMDIIEIEHYGEWSPAENFMQIEIYCRKFDEMTKKMCKKQDCNGYEAYKEYCQAKQDYVKMKETLLNNYSLGVMILAHFQRKFKSK